jgi:hypothetical protein
MTLFKVCLVFADQKSKYPWNHISYGFLCKTIYSYKKYKKKTIRAIVPQIESKMDAIIGQSLIEEPIGKIYSYHP